MLDRASSVEKIRDRSPRLYLPMVPRVSGRGWQCGSSSPLEMTVAIGLSTLRKSMEKSALPWWQDFAMSTCRNSRALTMASSSWASSSARLSGVSFFFSSARIALMSIPVYFLIR